MEVTGMRIQYGFQEGNLGHVDPGEYEASCTAAIQAAFPQAVIDCIRQTAAQGSHSLATVVDIDPDSGDFCFAKDTERLKKEKDAESAVAVICANVFSRLHLARAALAEYHRIDAAALAEYHRIAEDAFSEYIRGRALTEYYRITNPAWEEYRRIRAAARTEYHRITEDESASCANYVAMNSPHTC